MANVLILYASRHGQTERIAQRIAETVTREGHYPELVDVHHGRVPLDLERFQVVVLGGPIHGGRYPSALERFARKHHSFLHGVPSAFFSVGLAVQSRTSSGRGKTLEVVEEFIDRTGWHPARVELFAGALPYSKYNFLVRFVMKRIVGSERGDTDTSRDYEYTDWPAVERFARELVAMPVVGAQMPITFAPQRIDGSREIEEHGT